MLSESLDPPLLDDDDEELLALDDLLLPPPLLGLLACDERLREAEELAPLERLLAAEELDRESLDLRALLLEEDGRELLDDAALTWRVLELDEEAAEGDLRGLEVDAEDVLRCRLLDELPEVRFTTVRGLRMELDATTAEGRLRMDSREREAEEDELGRVRLAVAFDFERWSAPEDRLLPLSPLGFVGCDLDRDATVDDGDDERWRACEPRELED